MGLPIEFSTPRIDEQGRTFVVHQPTGVKYFVRERDHPSGHVTQYSRSASVVEYRGPKQKRKAARKAARKEPEGDRFARATFIEGSAP